MVLQTFWRSETGTNNNQILKWIVLWPLAIHILMAAGYIITNKLHVKFQDRALKNQIDSATNIFEE